MHIAFKNLKSTNRTKVFNSITIHVHARPCYIVSPWLDTLIVNLLVWNNSGLFISPTRLFKLWKTTLKPTNQKQHISCFTFMIDTRIIMLLNIFGLFIVPRLSTFNSGGNSNLIETYHFELEIWSTQIPKLPIKKKKKKKVKFEPILAQIIEKLTNFHLGSNFENFTNFPRKTGLLICQSVRFWGQNFRERGVLTRHGIRGRGSHFTKIVRKLWNQPFLR